MSLVRDILVANPIQKLSILIDFFGLYSAVANDEIVV